MVCSTLNKVQDDYMNNMFLESITFHVKVVWLRSPSTTNELNDQLMEKSKSMISFSSFTCIIYTYGTNNPHVSWGNKFPTIIIYHFSIYVHEFFERDWRQLELSKFLYVQLKQFLPGINPTIAKTHNAKLHQIMYPISINISVFDAYWFYLSSTIYQYSLV